MPKLRFIRDFDWRPRAGVIVAYRAGMEMSVTRAAAAKAVAVGAAVKTGQRPTGKGKDHGTGHQL